MDDIIKLNVGGKHFVTTRMTLCAEEGSMLSAKFNLESDFAAPTEFEGRVFLDRNPRFFEYVLDYLRHGCRMVYYPPEDHLNFLSAEADYFGLVGLKRASQLFMQRAAEQERQEKMQAATAKTKKKSKLVFGETDLYRGKYLENGWHVQEVLKTESTGVHNFILSRED